VKEIAFIKTSDPLSKYRPKSASFLISFIRRDLPDFREIVWEKKTVKMPLQLKEEIVINERINGLYDG